MKLESATAWSLLPIATLSVLSVVTVPVYYHSLGPELYALWFAVQTMTGTFGFMDLGLGVATGRYVGVALGRGDYAGARETWASGNLLNLVVLFLTAVLFGVVGTFFGEHWFKFPSVEGPVFWQCVWWSALGLFLNYYAQGWLVLLQAHLEFQWLALSRTFFSLFSGIGMAWAAWAFHSPLPSIVVGVGVAGLQLFFLVHRAKARHQMGFLFPSARWSRLKEMGSYTAKTFLSLLSGAAFGSLDRWFLGRVAGADSFVAYNIGSNLAGRVQGLSIAAMGPIFHSSSQGVGCGDETRLANIYLRSFRLLAPLYFAGALWVGVWQHPWLDLWLGSEAGARVALALPFLVGAASLGAVMNISGAQLGPLNLVGFGTVVQSSSWISSGLLAWGGWKLAGLSGAGAGLLLGRFVLFFQDLRIRSLIGVRLWDRKVFTLLSAILFSTALFRFVGFLVPGGRQTHLLLSLLNLLLVAGLCWKSWRSLGNSAG